MVWQKAMTIAEKVYLLSTSFPKDEKFGLKSQLRRSAISVPSNIAEGAGRNTNNEFKHFLGIASGSSNEMYTQLELCHRLKLVPKEKIALILNDLIEVQKINYSLIQKFSK